MKKFLMILVLSVLMVSFGNKKASAASDRYNSNTTNNKTQTALKTEVNEVKESLRKKSVALDPNIAVYIHPDDLKVIQENNITVIIRDGGYSATYDFVENTISLSPSFFLDETTTKELKQSALHHEIRHLKDNLLLEKKGYSIMTFMGTAIKGTKERTSQLDTTSILIFDGILEARAYAEDIVFAYKNMIASKGTPEYSTYKDYYDYFLTFSSTREPTNMAFDNAIKAGKSIEEARHLAEIAFLNSEAFKKLYINNFKDSKSLDMHSLSKEEIVKILQLLGNELTIDDLYQAKDFWINVCSVNGGPVTECAIKKQETSCSLIDCSRTRKLVNAEDTCSQGRKILVGNDIKKKYEGCCDTNWLDKQKDRTTNAILGIEDWSLDKYQKNSFFQDFIQ